MGIIVQNQKILAKEPYHAGANTELGHEQMLKANYKLANRYYLTALAGESTNLEALAGYGQSSYYLGNIDDAKNTFLKMLEIDETNGFAWAYLGKLEAETPEYAETHVGVISMKLTLVPEDEGTL